MTTKEQLHAEFEEQLGDLTLGILSGEKGSPVFVNNELEKPRLMNFLDQAYDRIREESLREVLGKTEVMYEGPDAFGAFSPDKKNEGHTRALEEVEAAIQSLITKK